MFFVLRFYLTHLFVICRISLSFIVWDLSLSSSSEPTTSLTCICIIIVSDYHFSPLIGLELTLYIDMFFRMPEYDTPSIIIDQPTRVKLALREVAKASIDIQAILSSNDTRVPVDTGNYIVAEVGVSMISFFSLVLFC